MSSEPALDAADPLARSAQTFPRLDPEMVQRIAAYAEEEHLAGGVTLFERGQRGVDFFVVMSGGIAVVDVDECGTERVISTHNERQFSGEVDLFNERQILVDGRTTGPTTVLRLRRPDFRRLMEGEPDIAEIIMRAFILRRVAFIRHGQSGVVLIGAAHAADTLRLQRFLTRNGFPHRQLDPDNDAGAPGILRFYGLSTAELPVVIATGREPLRNPSHRELAEALGLTEPIDPEKVFDVAVVGAGPAGLAAAVYAASEGLQTIVIEGTAPGGQAGTSSKIENYLGFPTGISGMALAGRAQMQAQKFGARLAIARHAAGLDCGSRPFGLRLDDGQTVRARTVVVATGARYRKLAVPEYERFEGSGIHYAATAMEGRLCENEEVAVVGGGNSAGQAAVFLARVAGHVHMMIRADGLAATMSDYLIRRIEGSPRITLHTRTEITGLEGETYLRRVTWTDRATGAAQTRDMANVFVMIGAEPNTEWLDGCIELDGKGFVRTGLAAASPFGTSLPDVFAVGDVRAGSVKRVASGVGEGSVVVSSIHQVLLPPVAA